MRTRDELDVIVLSKLEYMALVRLSADASLAEISKETGVSVHAVKAALEGVRRRLGTRTLAGCVALAVRMGLIA